MKKLNESKHRRSIIADFNLVLVLKYEAEDPVHPESGSSHDDMHLFDLVVEAIIE